MGESLGRFVEAVGLLIDVAGVLVILASVAFAGGRCLLHAREGLAAYHRLRQGIGRGILLGLELLVAADIIRTVAMKPTLDGVIILGIIVLIRTFLSMSLQVELEGRLPWRKTDSAAGAAESGRVVRPGHPGPAEPP